MELNKEDFYFSADQFGPSAYDITDFAALNDLVKAFTSNSEKLGCSDRELNFRYIGKLLEDIFSNSDYIQTKIRMYHELSSTQWMNKKKNEKRQHRDNRLPSIGKGTSVYLQSINHLIDYLMWGNGNCLNVERTWPKFIVPDFKPESERESRTEPFSSQEFAVNFVVNLLTDILMIEAEKDGSEPRYQDKVPTSLTQYLKREYQKFKLNPTIIPGLKPGQYISSRKLNKNEDFSSIIIQTHHSTSK
jgi:hypothetical protein